MRFAVGKLIFGRVRPFVSSNLFEVIRRLDWQRSNVISFYSYFVLLNLGEIQLYTQAFPVCKICQRREILQFFQTEIIEKKLGCSEQGGSARYIPMPDYSNPLALQKRAHDIAAD